MVERNTRTPAQLINDLLDVSRIGSGKLQLDLYPVDLTPIMEEVVERALAAGFYAYAAKPIEPTVLIDTVVRPYQRR